MIDDVFAVIADPTRRQILRVLAEGESPVGALVKELGVSQPTVSKHLKVLRTAGLVSTRAQGQRRLYSLIPEPLTAVTQWVEDLTARAGSEAGADSTPALVAVAPASEESAEGANDDIIAEPAVSEETSEEIAELVSSAAPADSTANDATKSEEVIIADSAEAPEPDMVQPEISRSAVIQPVIDQNRGIRTARTVEPVEKDQANDATDQAEPLEVAESFVADADIQEFGVVPAAESSSDGAENVAAPVEDEEETAKTPTAEYNESTEDALQNLIASVEARLASSNEFGGQEFTDFSEVVDTESQPRTDIEEAAQTYEASATETEDDTLHQIESRLVDADADDVLDAPENREIAAGTEDAVSPEDLDELVVSTVETADPVDSVSVAQPENHEVAAGTETAVSPEDVDDLIEESAEPSPSDATQQAVHFTPLTPFTPSAMATDNVETSSDQERHQFEDSAEIEPSTTEAGADAEPAMADTPAVAETETETEHEETDGSETGTDFTPEPLSSSDSAESEQDEDNQRGLLAAISRWGRRRR